MTALHVHPDQSRQHPRWASHRGLEKLSRTEPDQGQGVLQRLQQLSVQNTYAADAGGGPTPISPTFRAQILVQLQQGLLGTGFLPARPRAPRPRTREYRRSLSYIIPPSRRVVESNSQSLPLRFALVILLNTQP